MINRSEGRHSIGTVFNDIRVNEGYKAFFKGSAVRVFHVSTVAVTFFCSYEKVKSWLSRTLYNKPH